MVFIGVVAGFSFNKLINDKDNLPEKLKSERNLLVVLLDKDKNETEGLYVANISPIDESISVVSIPKSIKINIADEEKPFKRAYTENKTDDVKVSLENEIGIKINNYICLDKEFIKKLFDIVGEVNSVLPCDIAFENHIYKSGENVFDADDFSNIFMYIKTQMSGNSAKKAELNLVKGAFSALCGKDLSYDKSTQLMSLLKEAKTDIASYDFEEYIKILSYMKNQNVVSKEIKGIYEYKEGEMFFLSDKTSKTDFFK